MGGGSAGYYPELIPLPKEKGHWNICPICDGKKTINCQTCNNTRLLDQATGLPPKKTTNNTSSTK